MNEQANTSPGQSRENQRMQEAQEMVAGNKPAPVEDGREPAPFHDEPDPEELQEDLDSAPPGEPTG